jgi:hypothetical protein
MMKKRTRKFQSTLEYATLITIVIGALLWMKGWMQKGLQGKLKTVGDSFGEQFSDKTRSQTLVNSSSNSYETPDKKHTESTSKSSGWADTPGVTTK